MVIFARTAFLRKKAEIPQISANFTKFPEISRNLVNFTKFRHFEQNGSRNNKSNISEQLFKAEMVRFREHFRIFAKFHLFMRKTLISCKSGFGAEFPTFFGPRRTFSLLGLRKTSQELTFIKVSEPGPQKSDSGPRNHFWAPEMLKNVKFCTFW